MTPKAVDADDRRRLESEARTSTVPLLAPELSDGIIVDPANTDDQTTSAPNTAKTGKRRFFGLGKRRDDTAAVAGDQTTTAVGPAPPLSSSSSWGQTSPPRAISPTSVPSSSGRPSTSPHFPYQHPATTYRHCRSPSPGLPSPASSSIFERDVQESTLPAPSSSAIPSHIPREDYIPPVLEASSLAITDERLDPDEVKIVMHANHHPAGAAVTGPSSIAASVGTLPSDDTTAGHPDKDVAASGYGALDTHDHRRLSFISFADVVQAEHMAGPPPTSSPSHLANRSPSPVYSGTSSSQGLGTSPPTSGPASDGVPGPTSKGPGSPTFGHGVPPLAAGELTVETMRQALRKTGSSDLGGMRSQPLSAASGEEFGHDVPWR